MAVTHTRPYPSVRRGQATPRALALKSDDPVVRTAKLVQNRAGYWEIVYSEPRGKGLGWRSRTLSTRTQDAGQAQRELDRFVDAAIEKSQPTTPADQLTIEDLCRDYLVVRPQQRHALSVIRPYLGALRVSELTPDICRRYRDALGSRYKGDTLRRQLGALKAVINHARRMGTINIAPFIDMPPAGAPRAKWLSREQLALVRDKVTELEASRPGPAMHALKVFIFLASTFGARREAIRELSWDRVDWDHRTVSFQNPDKVENKKRRAIAPLSDEALLFLREVHLKAGRPVGGPVLAVSDETLRYAYRRFMDGLGMPWCTSHVFRHTLATHLLQDGRSIYHVAQVLADTVRTVEKTYAHVLPQDLREVMEGRKLGW